MWEMVLRCLTEALNGTRVLTESQFSIIDRIVTSEETARPTSHLLERQVVVKFTTYKLKLADEEKERARAEKARLTEEEQERRRLLAEERKRARLEEAKRREEERLREEEELRRREEEEARRAQEERVRAATSMDLPLDFENAFSDDDRVKDVRAEDPADGLFCRCGISDGWIWSMCPPSAACRSKTS